MNEMIQTKGLTKKYNAFLAVDNVELNIKTGEIYGFLGPNGAGKTTTMMMLLGIVPPTSGEIYLFGEKYAQNRLDLRKRMGVVPEKHPRGMWKWMTAREYLEFFSDFYRIRDVGKRIDYLLDKVDLTPFAQRRISTFSRGMLQKLSIIRALLPDPDILLLDEPHSGLDPNGMKKIRDLIVSENREGRTIFVSSHLLSEVEKICHRIAIINKGRLVAEDSMETLLSKIHRFREIVVELDKIGEGLVPSLRELPFVKDASLSGNQVTVHVPHEGDYRKSLSEFLIRKDLVPVKIQEKAVSLEDAFTAITNENIELFAGPGGRNE
jgi:ABC-type multidrug transport system ATPase subunit